MNIRCRLLVIVVLVLSCTDLVFPPVSAAQGFQVSWASAGSLNQGRYYHTATLMQNGKVIVTGGREGFSPLSTCEVFDPDVNGGKGRWQYVAGMIEKRERHAAILYSFGALLVTGGIEQYPRKSCEVYDPVGNYWTTINSFDDARYEHTLTRLGNGRVLAVGSKDYDRGLRSCELLILEEADRKGTRLLKSDFGKWRRTGSLQYGRGNHTATLLRNGKVLVTGGVHNYLPIRQCEIYDPDTEVWTIAASMNFERDGHTATLLGDGKVLVIGGRNQNTELPTCELFDPAANGGTGKWEMVSGMIYQRFNHTSNLLPNGYVLVTGTWVVGHGAESCELRSPAGSSTPGMWKETGMMSEKRSNHSVTLLSDTRILVVGGEIAGFQAATSSCDVSEPVLLDVDRPDPTAFQLTQNYPNPFHGSTTIQFSLKKRCPVELTVLDVLGIERRKFDLGEKEAGEHNFTVNRDGLAPDNYVYRLRAGEQMLDRTFTVY